MVFGPLSFSLISHILGTSIPKMHWVRKYKNKDGDEEGRAMIGVGTAMFSMGELDLIYLPPSQKPMAPLTA